jgi:predicted aconitase with swiveling domain
MAIRIRGKVLMPGTASGTLLASDEPLSFWGGYDHTSGSIIDRRHPLAGQTAAGRILAIPFTRGSSSTTAVLLEAIKTGTAPAAIVTTAPDSFFALAAIVADEMYSRALPLILVSEDDFRKLTSGADARIDEEGLIEVDSVAPF